MKKVKFFVLFVLIGFAKNINGQIFQKVFGGSGGEWVNTILQTIDGGYIIGGFTNSFGPANGNFYLIKTDSNGDTLWTKTYGGAGWEYGNFVQQCSDTGYIFVGRTMSFGSGNYDIYLIKTDANGNLIWSKTYGGAADESGKSVFQTSDGGYIIGGNTKSFGAGNADFYLIKTDNAGNMLWSKTFGGALDDYGYSAIQCSDSTYIISGYTCSFGVGACDIYVVKTDVNGDTLWSRTYGGTLPDGGYSIRQCSDGGFIITGKTDSYGTNGDAYLIKTDNFGNIIWSKSYGGPKYDFGNCVQETNDGGFIISGLYTPQGSSWTDVYLIKTDTNGDTLWTKTFGGTDEDEGAFVNQCTDNGYIIGSLTLGFGLGDWEIYIIKTDSIGNGNCNQNDYVTVVGSDTMQVTHPPTIVSSGSIAGTPSTLVGSGCIIITLCTSVIINENKREELKINIYPNPLSSKCNITIPDEFQHEKNLILQIFDNTGKLLQQTKVEMQQKKIKLNLEAEAKAKGVYNVTLSNGKKLYNGKIVFE